LYNGTIESQFDYLYRKSSTYQEYKVVKQTFYYKIKKNVLDSLKVLKNELAATKQMVTTQNTEIDELKGSLKTTNDNLTNVTKEKDSINLVGISLTKSSYNTILWSIIIGLVLFLLFFIYRFKNSNSVTKQANKSLAEIEEEFFAFKTISLEREQKVRRELQDEINKSTASSKRKK
jgi:preprotein translocase subunit SecF